MSKESTLQVVYDVLRLTSFFKAFLVTSDVPQIYMEMLHICPRIPNQTFDELSFKEEILAFLRYLGHSGEIKNITDVNINKLHQPWRSFATVINKCLSGKSTGYDGLRDDQMFTTIKLVSRHQNTQQFGVMLPVEVTNEDIRNSTTYKEYYAITSRAAPPKTKASVRKTQSSSETTMPPPTAANTRLLTSAKGAILGKTPYELLRGRKPTIDYFRVFGSKCFILNTKDYLTKFDPKSYEGVFLGYSQNSKAYIILNKHTWKIEESLNVTFNETPPPSKTSPLVDDDLYEEEAIRATKKKILENVVEGEILEIDKIELVPQPKKMTIIGTRWVFQNKLDENGVVSRNKAKLVAQGCNQQEGIDYDKTYASVARLESIRILLAYACALDFKLFQIDVKSAFLNGFTNEEIYVAQPLGFIDFEKLNHVYKIKKALYSLKQVPKAWYDRLKAFIVKHGYKMRMVDNTLFTKKKSSNLIIVQIYVDDIIFGLTCQDMCDEFAKI
nr:retrovirus-related Pol polyprotein from transposon TNT 1-94 [Tanacetum cinerariifolium]